MLWLLVAVSLLVFLPAAGWGIPIATAPDRSHAWGNDDLVPLAPLAEMHNTFVREEQNRNVAYPWFHYFLLAVAYAPYLVWLCVKGDLVLGQTQFPFGLRDPVTTFWVLSVIGRAISVALVTAGVAAVYVAGRTLWGRAAGVWAALFTLFMFPLVYYARLGNLDGPTLAWTAIAFAIAASILRYGWTTRRAVWLGAAAAIAVTTKDQAAGSFVLLGPALVAVTLADASVPKRRVLAATLIALVSSVLVFLIAGGAWADWSRFTRHIAKVFAAGTQIIYDRYPATAAGYLAQARDELGHLSDVLGWPVLALAAAGVVLAARRDRVSLVFVSSALGTFLMLLPVRFSRIHYLLPVALPLSLYAGYAAASLIARTRHRVLATGLVALATLTLPVLCSIELTDQMRRDSRYAAGAWLQERLRQGDSVVYFGAPLKLPHLPAAVRSAQVEWQRDARPTLARERPQFVLAISEDTDEERRRVDWRQGRHSVYNSYLPDDVFGDLANGKLGYVLVAQFQTPRLFPWLRRPFLSYATVNPPVLIFAREDRAAGLPRLSPWRTAPYYPRHYRVYEPPRETVH